MAPSDPTPDNRDLPLHWIDYSLRRYYVDEFQRRHATRLPHNGLVLDLGGTKERKRGFFDIEQYPVHVLYANLSIAKRPDVSADAARVPFDRATFDAVVCAELLEHVPEPRAVLQEAARVLRPGGVLMLTVPFLFRVHGDPYDYGRYTEHYWLSALDNGFDEIHIERQGLFYAVMADFFKQYVNECVMRKRRRKLLRWVALRLQGYALKRERRPKQNSFIESFTTGYGIVARRKEDVR